MTLNLSRESNALTAFDAMCSPNQYSENIQFLIHSFTNLL